MFFETYRDQTSYYYHGDNICPAHFHRSPEVMYVLSGSKTAWLDGKQYEISEGEMLVCTPYALHLFPPSENGVQIVASIPSEYCSRFERLCQANTPVSPIVKDENGVLLKLITALKNQKNPFLFEGIANCLFGFFTERIGFVPTKAPSERSIVDSIAKYIDENYSNPLTLDGLALEFGYSPNYFSFLFKKHFKTGVTQYINFTRVIKSLKLLKSQKISSVYFLCGFKSPQQYFLNFKRYFGCTPKEYMSGKKRFD